MTRPAPRQAAHRQSTTSEPTWRGTRAGLLALVCSVGACGGVVTVERVPDGPSGQTEPDASAQTGLTGPEEDTHTYPGNEPQDPFSAPGQRMHLQGPLGRIDIEYEWDLAAEVPAAGSGRVFRLLNGTIPPGLELAEDGTVRGVPTAAAEHECTVVVASASPEGSAALEVDVTVAVAPVILLSGFGPFAGIEKNPSWLALEPMHEELIDGFDVRTVELPVVWEEAPRLLRQQYDHFRPVVVIPSGVAAGETVIRIEAVARNAAFGRDIQGEQGPGRIEDALPTDHTYDATLPVYDLRDALRSNSFPAAVTDNAGAYLCNYVFYKTMHWLAGEPADMAPLGGFVHVPDVDVVTPQQMTEAWRIMLRQLARALTDRSITKAGASHTPRPEADRHDPPRYDR